MLGRVTSVLWLILDTKRGLNNDYIRVTGSPGTARYRQRRSHDQLRVLGEQVSEPEQEPHGGSRRRCPGLQAHVLRRQREYITVVMPALFLNRCNLTPTRSSLCLSEDIFWWLLWAFLRLYFSETRYIFPITPNGKENSDALKTIQIPFISYIICIYCIIMVSSTSVVSWAYVTSF